MTPRPSQGVAPVRFERATAVDASTLLALAREYYDYDAIPFDEAAMGQGFAHLLADAALGGAWSIRRGHDVVGYFVVTYGFDLEFGGRQATVTELYLRPEARRGGIGTAAIRHIEEHLRGLGIGAYELQVERDNSEARAFYARVGFQAHDRIPMSKRIGRAAGDRP
jgi:GNAT superfamily N-acetyltransferase